MVNLQARRKELGLSQVKLAGKLGVSRSTVAMWETGKSQPDNGLLVKIATILGTTTDHLLGVSNDNAALPKKPDGQNWVPVLGAVRAGMPIDAVEMIEDWEQLTPEMARNGTHVGLRVVGDSMEPRFRAGDVVIVHVQPDIESGEIGIVIINGDTATIKKIIKQDGGIMLVASNPSYAPRFFTNEDMDTMPVRIFGKVVELRAKF